jgi:hypothetical protein
VFGTKTFGCQDSKALGRQHGLNTMLSSTIRRDIRNDTSEARIWTVLKWTTYVNEALPLVGFLARLPSDINLNGKAHQAAIPLSFS